MADGTDQPQSGRQSRQSMRAPDRHVQFADGNGNGNGQRVESPSTRATSIGSSFIAPLRRLAPQRTLAPRPGPRPPSPPSVRIAPIRRMAPQRETASRPAWQEPLLQPPPAGSSRRSHHPRAFVTSQTGLFPLFAGHSEAELDQLVPRPRDITFLPPVTAPPPSSRGASPAKQPTIAATTPPKDNGSIHQQGFEGSSISIPPATPPKFIVPLGPSNIPASLFKSVPPPTPIQPQLQMGPQSPFETLTPHIFPNKPLPEVPQTSPSRFFARLPQCSGRAEFSLPEYRPRTPPPSSFLSQSEMDAACRSASLPSLPTLGGQSWAKRSLAVKYFKSRPTGDAKDAMKKDALTPVKFIDYLKIPSFNFANFPKDPEDNLSNIPFIEAPAPFGPLQAKIFVLKLVPAMQNEKEGRPATQDENQAHVEVTTIAKSWLLSSEVSHFPNFSGNHYGICLFKQARALNNNWLVVEGVPKFLWGMWTVPCTEIQGRKMGWEWYLRVQDVFFRSVLEGYYGELAGEFVLLRGVAYPINTIVPKEGVGKSSGESGGDMRGGVA